MPLLVAVHERPVAKHKERRAARREESLDDLVLEEGRRLLLVGVALLVGRAVRVWRRLIPLVMYDDHVALLHVGCGVALILGESHAGRKLVRPTRGPGLGPVAHRRGQRARPCDSAPSIPFGWWRTAG